MAGVKLMDAKETMMGPNEVQTISNPDILIVEGVNVLQVDKENQVFVSDFFDFSLYVDAEIHDIESDNTFFSFTLIVCLVEWLTM